MARKANIHNVLKAAKYGFVSSGLLLWLLMNCFFQSSDWAQAVSLTVDSPEHQFGDTVSFSLSIKTEALAPAVSDVYAVLTFPDAPLIHCGDKCTPVFTFESIRKSCKLVSP